MVFLCVPRGYDTDCLEGAIDALSYHTLHQPEHTRYFSIAGEMNAMQRDLLASAIMKKLPDGGTILIATDNNTGGTHLAASIREIAGAAGRADLSINEHRPEREGEDWNNVLKDMAPDSKPGVSPTRTADKEPGRA